VFKKIQKAVLFSLHLYQIMGPTRMKIDKMDLTANFFKPFLFWFGLVYFKAIFIEGVNFVYVF